mmetsp:Transcript_102960/g.290851  ORF Transcript_102960/g.290851 Transcript_102960/m.290851 type:complete len:316 (-) Transcript_102960:159-1106(-)
MSDGTRVVTTASSRRPKLAGDRRFDWAWTSDNRLCCRLRDSFWRHPWRIGRRPPGPSQNFPTTTAIEPSTPKAWHRQGAGRVAGAKRSLTSAGSLPAGRPVCGAPRHLRPTGGPWSRSVAMRPRICPRAFPPRRGHAPPQASVGARAEFVSGRWRRGPATRTRTPTRGSESRRRHTLQRRRSINPRQISPSARAAAMCESAIPRGRSATRSHSLCNPGHTARLEVLSDEGAPPSPKHATPVGEAARHHGTSSLRRPRPGTFGWHGTLRPLSLFSSKMPSKNGMAKATRSRPRARSVGQNIQLRQKRGLGRATWTK